MKINVNVGKLTAELRPVDSYQRKNVNKLSKAELEVLVARLQGSASHTEMGARCGRSGHNFSIILDRVRGILGAAHDMELAMLAYERGYVTIEEEA